MKSINTLKSSDSIVVLNTNWTLKKVPVKTFFARLKGRPAGNRMFALQVILSKDKSEYYFGHAEILDNCDL